MFNATTNDIIAGEEINPSLFYAHVAKKEALVPTHVGDRLFRFMSHDEYDMLMSGEVMFSSRNHAARSRTASKGFCFLTVRDIRDILGFYGANGIEDWRTVQFAYEFLSGIVSDDVCVMFENVTTHLEDSYGVYADPMTDDWYGRITVPEVCTDAYSIHSMRPICAFEMFRDDSYSPYGFGLRCEL